MELETDELPPYKLEFTALRKGNITESHGINTKYAVFTQEPA